MINLMHSTPPRTTILQSYTHVIRALKISPIRFRIAKTHLGLTLIMPQLSVVDTLHDGRNEVRRVVRMVCTRPGSLRESAESTGDIDSLQAFGHCLCNERLRSPERELIGVILVVLVENLPELSALCAGRVVGGYANVAKGSDRVSRVWAVETSTWLGLPPAFDGLNFSLERQSVLCYARPFLHDENEMDVKTKQGGVEVIYWSRPTCRRLICSAYIVRIQRQPISDISTYRLGV